MNLHGRVLFVSLFVFVFVFFLNNFEKKNKQTIAVFQKIIF